MSHTKHDAVIFIASALVAVLSALLAFSGAASAFTLAEHEKNIEKYVQALNKSPEVVKTYCEMDGTISERSGALGGEDNVRYVQAKSDYAVELRPVGGVMQMRTMNPAFKLPDGTGVGDPIERVMKAALIPGDYFRDEEDGFVHHIWLRDGRLTMISEYKALIFSIAFLNDVKMKGVTINDAYAKFLASGGEGEPAAKTEAVPPPANSELNDSTDAKIINSYPLSANDKNTLGIQHRGAYTLYSQKKYQQAYEAFSKLADDYDVNYLSAYWAGVTARQLKKDDEAKAWFERALAINPNYNPAKDALSGKSSVQSTTSASGGSFVPEGFTPRKDWDKLLSKQDLALAGKIYDVLTSFGTNREEAAKSLGKPVNSFSDEWYNGVHSYYVYGKDERDFAKAWNNAALGLDFIVENGESYVTALKTTSAKYKLKHISVGDSIEKARKTFGEFDYDYGGQFSYRADLRQLPDAGMFEYIEITFYADKNKKKIESINVIHVESGSAADYGMDENEHW
ncbi:MAG: tetratricopeptide repeat protein [Synergistaceae bacterium]|nr:tetratricopeptide repeat protein [Synergistaceae bacterium]